VPEGHLKYVASGIGRGYTLVQYQTATDRKI